MAANSTRGRQLNYLPQLIDSSRALFMRPNELNQPAHNTSIGSRIFRAKIHQFGCVLGAWQSFKESHQPDGCISGNVSRDQFLGHPFWPGLVHLVEGHQCITLLCSGNAGLVQQPIQYQTMVQFYFEVFETKVRQYITSSRANFSFNDHRARAQYINVTLVELTKPSARRPVCAPHRLNLVTFEKLRKLVAILGNEPR